MTVAELWQLAIFALIVLAIITAAINYEGKP